jgi:hypothetical protein
MSRPTVRTQIDPDDLAAFLASWPPGLTRLETEEGTDVYGIILRRGDGTVWGTAATWAPGDHAFDQADHAARAVLVALAKHRGEPLAAAAFVRPNGDAFEAGVVVFAFDGSSSTPGAERPIEAESLLRGVAERVGAPLSASTPTPFDALGRFHLEGIASHRGLLLVPVGLRDDDDPVWAELFDAGVVSAPHLPSVGFVEEDA